MKRRRGSILNWSLGELVAGLSGLPLFQGKALPPTAVTAPGHPTNEVNAIETMTDLQLYTTLSSVYAAVYAKANAAAQVPLRVKRNRRGSDEDLSGSDHPLVTLLSKRPNALHTPYEVKEAINSFIALAGDAFVKLEGGQAETGGIPEEMFVLKSHRVTPIPADGVVIAGYEYDVGKTPIRYDRNEVVHFTTFSPLKDYTGQGSIEAGRLAAICDLYAIAVNKGFFKNGAQFSGMLMFDENISEEEMKRTLDEFNRQYSGAGNAGAVRGIAGVEDYKQTSPTFSDMLFNVLRTTNFLEIARVERVPPVLLGSLEGASFANAREQVKIFWQTTMLPMLMRQKDRWNHSLAPRYGPDIEIYYDLGEVDALQRNLVEMMQIAVQMFTARSITPNEIRRMVATREWPDTLMDPVEGGDTVYGTLAQVPADEDLDLDLELEDPEEPNEPAEDETEPEDQETGEQVESFLASLDRFEERARAHLNGAGQLAEIKRIVHGEILKGIATRRRQGTRLFRRTARRVFTAQGKKILEALPDLVSDAAQAASVTPTGKRRTTRTSKAWKRDFEIAFKQHTTLDSIFEELQARNIAAFKAAFAVLTEATGKDVLSGMALEVEFSMTAPGVQEFLEREGAQLVKGVDKTTIEALAKELADGAAEGESITQLSSRVKKVMNTANRARAVRIATTETTKTLGYASLESYRQTNGAVQEKEWQTAGDSEVRGSSPDDDFDHFSAHGQRRALNQAYEVSGEALMYPGDISGGASSGNIVNCRCANLPVISANNIGYFTAILEKAMGGVRT